MSEKPKTLNVPLGDRSYDIIIGESLLADAGRYLLPVLNRPNVVIVTDSNVAQLHLKILIAALERSGIAQEHIILPAGEQAKSFRELQRLMNKLLSLKPDRNITLIALGGGVIGDITGFAASILLRGVDFIQIPTTLLAQVDSSVGGKTGINTRHGKNLIGSFYQPKLVLCDIGLFATLPLREMLAGYAEIVKYGIINDYPFFAWLEENGAKALSGDKAGLAHMVYESCKAKADIVAQDEREAGARALLNFGHTLGHALEAETGYSDALLHGEAVSIGMALALKLSVQLKLCSDSDTERVIRHLQTMGMKISPGEVQARWDARRLISHCYRDKKASDGGLTFILVTAIGKSFISHEVTRNDLKALLAETL